MIGVIRAQNYRGREIAAAFSDEAPPRTLWRVAIENGELHVSTLEDEFAYDVEIVTSPQRFLLDDDEIVFVYAIEGAASVDDTSCPAGDTIWLQEADGTSIRSEGRAAVVRITPI
ncbi:MAG TPA: hypothetical protein VMA98_06185 [Candidatus Acidoferrales bacterium]|nr:hypothetical protein [Candidatus Acidoferrales bacterium]